MTDIPEPHLRYLVFAMEQYYPSGGLGDLKATFDTFEEAKKYEQNLDVDGWQWTEIYDRIEGKEVW